MDLFKKYKLKRTKTREIIIDGLECIKKPISAEELYAYLSKNHDINLATVYRNLNTLAEIGFINKVVRQDGIAYYSLEEVDIHYMVCDSCNKQIELDHCPIDHDFFEKINKSGFKSKGHIFEIHGVCKDCQNEKE
ncbi:Fur family transcriptional regulator [Neofamilia massiliensis]|uniref:Fur family transcriptional regulator n=1 Tax=Neofamilia massiliensis TaxID=1673724 RepID=UPI0006BB5F20|nr:Fur family transcriptional regulator [Neofamilia massiliensis]